VLPRARKRASLNPVVPDGRAPLLVHARKGGAGHGCDRGACGGADLGKADVKVCIRVPGTGKRARYEVRTFSTMNDGLLELRDWLVENRIARIGMEATASYWKPLFYLLEATERRPSTPGSPPTTPQCRPRPGGEAPPGAAPPASLAAPRRPPRRAHPPRSAPPDTAPGRSPGTGAPPPPPPEPPAPAPARLRVLPPAPPRPFAALPKPPASMAPATPTTSRPATGRDCRSNRDLMPDQQKPHTRFGKRTTSELDH
jgi:hypothetical protein